MWLPASASDDSQPPVILAPSCLPQIAHPCMYMCAHTYPHLKKFFFFKKRHTWKLVVWRTEIPLQRVCPVRTEVGWEIRGTRLGEDGRKPGPLSLGQPWLSGNLLSNSLNSLILILEPVLGASQGSSQRGDNMRERLSALAQSPG